MGIKKIPQSIFLEKSGCVVEERLLYMLVPKSLRGQLLPGLGSFFLTTLRLKGRFFAANHNRGIKMSRAV